MGPSDAKNLKQTNKKTDPDIVMVIRPHVYNEEEQVTAWLYYTLYRASSSCLFFCLFLKSLPSTYYKGYTQRIL